MRVSKLSIILVTIVLASVMVLSSFLLGCSSSPVPSSTTAKPATSTAPAQASNEVIRWGSSSVGSSGYVLSAGMTNLIGKYSSYQASVTPTTGAAATIRAIDRGERDFGFGTTYEVFTGYNGTDDFAPDGKQKILSVAMTYTAFMAFVAQPGINTVNDFKGKIFMYRRKAQNTWGVFGDAVLKAYGLGEDTVKIKSSVETSELTDGLKTGAVEIALIPGAAPNSFVTELMESKKYSIVSVDKDILAAINKASPYIVPGVIPANTYKGQDKDILTGGYVNMVFCRADLPDEMVYQVTKAIFSHLDEFGKVDPLAKKFTLQSACQNLPTPAHPGAIKFFQEAGVWGK